MIPEGMFVNREFEQGFLRDYSGRDQTLLVLEDSFNGNTPTLYDESP